MEQEPNSLASSICNWFKISLPPRLGKYICKRSCLGFGLNWWIGLAEPQIAWSNLRAIFNSRNRPAITNLFRPPLGNTESLWFRALTSALIWSKPLSKNHCFKPRLEDCVEEDCIASEILKTRPPFVISSIASFISVRLGCSSNPSSGSCSKKSRLKNHRYSLSVTRLLLAPWFLIDSIPNLKFQLLFLLAVASRSTGI